VIIAAAESKSEEAATSMHKCYSTVSLADTAYEHCSIDRTGTGSAGITLAFSSKLYSPTCPTAAAPRKPRRQPVRQKEGLESNPGPVADVAAA
jgi:hypothetical protein